ncbi:MAG: hypothetical protein IPL46_08790 [Saprospiraceae bacterium]|nr:hypothetical protein [Saprospiraceae bacterium]
MNREKILDYLYGEMAPDEKVVFEKTIAINAVLQKEIDEFQMVREYLGQSKDQTGSPIQMVVNAPVRRNLWNRWWTVAASLLLLLMAGKFLDLRVTIDQHQLSIGYGNLQSVSVDPNLELQQQYVMLGKSLGDLQSQLASYQEMVSHPEQTLPSGQKVDMRELAKMVGNMVEKEQETTENRLAEKILEDQQIAIQSMAQGLIRYWDEQRKNDLQMINTGMENLVRAVQMNSQDLTQFVNNTQQNY